MTTAYHSQYFAYELTKRLASYDDGKLTQSLLNATVQLNPHQIEAALFAFRSPLSLGAVLADEVGLGKTIEAGLILSQLWAERKKQILCIVPASLRKQWNRELIEKFFIPSEILEAKSHRAFKKECGGNPFDQSGKVIICSYEFARSKMKDIQKVAWNLVVIDEAHRLRNVYKKTNKVARDIRDAIGNSPKLLLTATPLQNSLMELYGLISFIDPYLFGDKDSFRLQFTTRSGVNSEVFNDLKRRIEPICHRTLRRQVTEHVPYTNRNSFTQDFTPTDDETRLYESVSAYLQKDQLIALPASQRHLITLVLRKILASSSFAITATLGSLISRLEQYQADLAQITETDISVLIGADLENSEDLLIEWNASQDDLETCSETVNSEKHNSEQKAIAEEINELKAYKALAESISVNAKGEALLKAIEVSFERAKELQSPRKVLIFTESRRTQTYIKELLEQNGYTDEIVTFNGTNDDPVSKRIYQEWLETHQGKDCISGSPTSDKRAALVERFQNEASIMVATESAAEGVNLQFCNVVVNYDLPWNPQRIEQRIGRCHRYGQKFDVTVINFLNRKNEADQRVFELLDEKFRLFSGVFGASDEILGTLESGVDFERRILEIHNKCRTREEIAGAFDELQRELEEQINARMEQARTTLLENFDEEVHEKLLIREQVTEKQISKYERWLFQLVATELGDLAVCNDEDLILDLVELPVGVDPSVSTGSYGLITHQDHSADHHLRFDHPLVKFLIDKAKLRKLPATELTFNYSDYQRKVSLAEKWKDQRGWLRVSLCSIKALEEEQHLIVTGISDEGEVLHAEECAAFFSVPGKTGDSVSIPADLQSEFALLSEAETKQFLATNEIRNLQFFSDEEEKLDRWADDLKLTLDNELKDLTAQVKDTRKQSREAKTLASKIEFQTQIKDLERKLHGKRKRSDVVHEEIDSKRDSLIEEAGKRLQQLVNTELLFSIRWIID